jgi:hypothetical protein
MLSAGIFLGSQREDLLTPINSMGAPRALIQALDQNHGDIVMGLDVSHKIL